MTIIAIDPGKNGAIVFGYGAWEVKCHKMPDSPEKIRNVIRDGLRGEDEAAAFIENVVPYIPRGVGNKNRQPGSRAFVLGRNVGQVETACACYEVDVTRVTPQKWQKSTGAGSRDGREDTAWKNHLKAIAQEKFPGEKVTLWNADALLILAHAREVFAASPPPSR